MDVENAALEEEEGAVVVSRGFICEAVDVTGDDGDNCRFLHRRKAWRESPAADLETLRDI